MSVLAQSKVLVLNRGWNPIGVVSLKRALKLVTADYKKNEPKARIMDPENDFRLFTWEDWGELVPADDEKAIHSGSRAWKVPEIILVSRYNKLPTQRIHFSRRTIYRRDGNKCQYCGRKPGTAELNIDHIVPRAQGGKTTWENCILSCIECNSYKADIAPREDVVYVPEISKNVTFYTVSFRNDKKQWQVKIQEPKKPKYTLYKGEYKCKAWESILGAAYWLTELENDNS